MLGWPQWRDRKSVHTRDRGAFDALCSERCAGRSSHRPPSRTSGSISKWDACRRSPDPPEVLISSSPHRRPSLPRDVRHWRISLQAHYRPGGTTAGRRRAPGVNCVVVKAGWSLGPCPAGADDDGAKSGTRRDVLPCIRSPSRPIHADFSGSFQRTARDRIRTLRRPLRQCSSGGRRDSGAMYSWRARWQLISSAATSRRKRSWQVQSR